MIIDALPIFATSDIEVEPALQTTNVDQLKHLSMSLVNSNTSAFILYFKYFSCTIFLLSNPHICLTLILLLSKLYSTHYSIVY